MQVYKKEKLFFLSMTALALTLMGLAWYLYQHHYFSKKIKIDGVVLDTPTPIPHFNFTDQNNHVFTEENLKGRWTFMFFGFTNCGYVCPTTLTELNKMYKILQKKSAQNILPQIVFVSVDPERDTIQRIGEYIDAFNSKFIGIRADANETEILEKQLHILAVKVKSANQTGDHYSINHTAEILLINPKGHIQAYLSFPHRVDSLIKDYQLILRKYG